MAADKQDKVLNVPTLRFPGFTGEWRKDRIRNLFAINVGGDIDKKEVSDIQSAKHPYPVIANALSNDGIYGYTSGYKDDAPNITVTGRGDVGFAKYRNYPLYPIVRLLVLHSNGNIDCRFGEHAINRIKKYEESTGVPQLTAPQLGAYSICYPCLNEQSKIGDFLCLLEDRIITQIRIIEDLKSLSDVICERLYNPSEKGEWQTYKYEDLFSVSNERNSKLLYKNVLSASQEYGMIERNELNIDIKFEESSITNYKIVRPNQYVIHLRSFQGGFAYSEKTGVCSPAYTILVPNENLATAFLKYYFTSKKFIDSLRIVTYGIRDGRSISVEEFLQLKVNIPDISQQNHIVCVMQLWEEKIRTEEAYLFQLQCQKMYLLSTMFV